MMHLCKCEVVTGTTILTPSRRFETAGANARGTECVHIFSDSTNVNISKDSKKASVLHTCQQYGVLHAIFQADSPASAWTILSRLSGRNNLLDELNGCNIHHLENVMTMRQDVKYLFDRFSFWFKPTVYHLFIRSY